MTAVISLGFLGLCLGIAGWASMHDWLCLVGAVLCLVASQLPVARRNRSASDDLWRDA